MPPEAENGACRKVCEQVESRADWLDDPPPSKWSALKYGFRAEGGLRCRGRDTSLKRLSPSCAKWMFWLRRAPRWRRRSARLGGPRSADSPLTKCLFSQDDGPSACSRRSELEWRYGRGERSEWPRQRRHR